MRLLLWQHGELTGSGVDCSRAYPSILVVSSDSLKQEEQVVILFPRQIVSVELHTEHS